MKAGSQACFQVQERSRNESKNESRTESRTESRLARRPPTPGSGGITKKKKNSTMLFHHAFIMVLSVLSFLRFKSLVIRLFGGCIFPLDFPQPKCFNHLYHSLSLFYCFLIIPDSALHSGDHVL